jgi:hypothetical protein
MASFHGREHELKLGGLRRCPIMKPQQSFFLASISATTKKGGGDSNLVGVAPMYNTTILFICFMGLNMGTTFKWIEEEWMLECGEKTLLSFFHSVVS